MYSNHYIGKQLLNSFSLSDLELALLLTLISKFQTSRSARTRLYRSGKDGCLEVCSVAVSPDFTTGCDVNIQHLLNLTLPHTVVTLLESKDNILAFLTSLVSHKSFCETQVLRKQICQGKNNSKPR